MFSSSKFLTLVVWLINIFACVQLYLANSVQTLGYVIIDHHEIYIFKYKNNWLFTDS